MSCASCSPLCAASDPSWLQPQPLLWRHLGVTSLAHQYLGLLVLHLCQSGQLLQSCFAPLPQAACSLHVQLQGEATICSKSAISRSLLQPQPLPWGPSVFALPLFSRLQLSCAASLPTRPARSLPLLARTSRLHLPTPAGARSPCPRP